MFNLKGEWLSVELFITSIFSFNTKNIIMKTIFLQMLTCIGTSWYTFLKPFFAHFKCSERSLLQIASYFRKENQFKSIEIY